MVILPTIISTSSRAETARPSARHECKFLVPARCLDLVSARLEQVCVADAEHGGNWVKSLYFDTPRLDLLHQKESSDYRKQKVRIRWYLDSRTGIPDRAVTLEIKCKDGARGWKKRIPLPVESARWDHDPLREAEGIGEIVDPTGEIEVLLRGLLPVCVIRYHRRRFTEEVSGFRLALDTQIRAESIHPAVVRGERTTRPDMAVLEVKGHGARRLPPPLGALGRMGVRKVSYSKYAACLVGGPFLDVDPQ